MAIACTQMDMEPFPTLREVKAAHVRRAIDFCGGNMAKTAKVLGIDRRTLYRLAGPMRDPKALKLAQVARARAIVAEADAAAEA